MIEIQKGNLNSKILNSKNEIKETATLQKERDKIYTHTPIRKRIHRFWRE